MRKQHSYYVYITTNPNKKVLYIGVTNNLARRLVEHYANKGTNLSFTGKYYAYNLIYCEHFRYINNAIAREKELKKWNRQRKETLIASKNPEWKFYNKFYCGEWPPRKNWGEYLIHFQEKQSKKAAYKSAITPKEDPICIYEDDLTSILPVIPKTVSKKIELEDKLQTLDQQIWNHSSLSERERYLVTLSVLTSLNEKEGFIEKIKEMPEGVLSAVELNDLFLQIGLYTGLPIAKSAKMWANSALSEK